MFCLNIGHLTEHCILSLFLFCYKLKEFENIKNALVEERLQQVSYKLSHKHDI